ncbi:MAG TPA: MiaB/RimO family radical SAM methylthiotransferase [Phycisphaerales bacterium]|nr:MiaB/RimO family radical SAM methylthiotransferase [Phycisphaerales bacterium]
MSARKVYLETFGCQMNELDSELVAGQLRALGYKFVNEADEAGVVLYNTCSVRELAEQKVWSRLGELKARKKADPALVVGVLGCMAERDGTDLIKRMPVVDVLCGPGELDKLPSLLDNAVRTRLSLVEDERAATGTSGRPASQQSAAQVALQGSSSRRSATLAAAQDTLELLDLSRAISPVDAASAGETADGDAASRPRTAYVRITRGCNKFCTYCVVPFTRGAEVHRPPQHIIDECKRLADAGVIEITLLGQTVNHYRFEHGAAVTLNGLTQPQKGRTYAGGHSRDPFAGENVTTFADLLRRIHDEVPSIQRLRFVTSYPRDFGDDVLEVMRHHPRICRYIHAPVQSGSDRMLKMMNRGYTVGEYIEFVDRVRSHLHQPEIGRSVLISSDFIVGFPTETEEDFEATCRLVEQCRFKNSFIFKYSARPGTVAFDKLADDVPESDKRRRNNTLLDIQNGVTTSIGRDQVGTTVDVLVEGLSQREMKKSGLTQGDIRSRGLVAITVGGRDTGLGASCGTGYGCSPPRDSEHAADAKVQLVSRTDTDLIVFFDAERSRAQSLVGTVQQVRITAADGVGLQGNHVPASTIL